MPAINVSDRDFEIIAAAAVNALKRGDMQAAEDLDKIARKINAAITNAASNKRMANAGMSRQSLTWRDVPSFIAQFLGSSQKGTG